MSNAQDPPSDRDPLERLAEEFLERLRGGERPSIEEYAERHPDLAQSIRELLPAMIEMERLGDDDSLEPTRLAPASASAKRAAAPTAIGPYRILRELGAGGMGVVYLAEDARLSRRVALKVLTPALASSAQLLLRFHREAEIASKLEHPSICTVYEAGESDGVAWIAMRYVEGETLAQWIDDRRVAETPVTREDVATVLRWTEEVARALHTAHEAGLIHRDVKPGNIMIDTDGRAVVLDFGLARPTEGGDDATLTQTGALLGTPAYMSPEQILSVRYRLDRRTDVYSLGVTLYECLTLKRPFDAATAGALYQEILSSQPESPRRLNPTIGDDLRVVVQTAMDRERDRRYATASDFAEDVRRVREHEPIRARPASAALRLRRWAERNPVLATSTVGLFLTLVVGLSVALHLLGKVTDERDAKDSALGKLEVETEAKTSALAEAEAERDAKDEALQRTRSLALVAAAEVAEGEDGMLSLLLAREAARHSLTPAVVRQLRSSIHASHEIAVFRGHESVVTGAAFSPDGRRIVTTSIDGTARVWRSDGTEIAVLDLEDASSASAVFSPLGDRIVTFSESRNSPVLWDADGRHVARLEGDAERGRVHRVLFVPSSSHVVVFREEKPTSGSEHSETVGRLWNESGGDLGIVTLSKAGAFVRDLDGGPPRRLCEADRLSNRGVAMVSAGQLPEGQRKAGDWVLISRSGDNVFAHGTDANEQREVDLGVNSIDLKIAVTEHRYVATDRNGAVRVYAYGMQSHPWHRCDDISFCTECAVPDVRWVAFDEDGHVDHLALEDNELLAILTPPRRVGIWGAHDEEVDTALCPSASLLAVAFREDERTHLYDLDGRHVAALTGHRAGVTSVAFSPDGESVLTTSRDGTARLWRVESPEVAAHRVSTSSNLIKGLGEFFGGDESRWWTLSTASNQDLFFAASQDGLVCCATFEGETGASLSDEDVHLGESGVFLRPTLPRIAPTGDRVLTRWRDRTARLVALDGREIAVLRGHADDVIAGDFSPTGDRIATSSADGVVRLWTADGAFVASLEREGAQFHSPLFSPDGAKLVALSGSTLSGSDEKAAHVWSSDGELLASVALDRAADWREWSSAGDGLLLSSWNRRNGGALWQPSRDEAVSLPVPHVWVADACFSGSGDRVLTACLDGTVRVFDLEGTQVGVLHSGAARPTCLAASRHAAICVVGLEDGTSRVYGMDGELLAELVGHRRAVLSAVFSASGRYIATLGADGAVRTWAVHGEDLLAIADKRATRDFTVDERHRFADLLGDPE